MATTPPPGFTPGDPPAIFITIDEENNLDTADQDFADRLTKMLIASRDPSFQPDPRTVHDRTKPSIWSFRDGRLAWLYVWLSVHAWSEAVLLWRAAGFLAGVSAPVVWLQAVLLDRPEMVDMAAGQAAFAVAVLVVDTAARNGWFRRPGPAGFGPGDSAGRPD